MRLLDTKTLEIHEFLGDTESQQFPQYAILSHTWGEEECSLHDMSLPEAAQKAGFKKIKFCCEQAVKDGLRWAWVDTCCIDKTSTAELSEAINSMFRWYRDSVACYVYLADVQRTDGQDLGHSRWLTRGWTLQELIAPREVRFYNQDWCFIGSKSERSIQECLTRTTGIEASVLLNGQLEYVPIARKMSWAANRSTTRVEDASYSLLGLFDVSMPLCYGEGKKAFLRLQQEIMKVSDDHSLFVWGLEAQPITLEGLEKIGRLTDPRPSHGFLAESPAAFKIGEGIYPIHDLQSDIPPIFTDNGLQIRLPIVRGAGIICAAVSCTMDDHLDSYLAIPLVYWGSRYTARCASPVLIRSGLVTKGSPQTLLVKRASDTQPPKVRPVSLKIEFGPPLEPWDSKHIHTIPYPGPLYHVGELLLPQHATRSDDGMITLDNIGSKINVPHAVVIIRGIHPLGLVFGGNAECKDGLWCSILTLLKYGEKVQDIQYRFLEYNHNLIVFDHEWCITEQEVEDRLLRQSHIWESLPSMPIIDGQRSRILIDQHSQSWTHSDGSQYSAGDCHFSWSGETFLTLDFQFVPFNLVSSGHRVLISLQNVVHENFSMIN